MGSFNTVAKVKTTINKLYQFKKIFLNYYANLLKIYNFYFYLYYNLFSLVIGENVFFFSTANNL